MQDAREEVRSRLNIEDVIGEYVQLKRSGRNYKGLSPFTSEKTPSFYVSPDKNIWHDFSSNKGGDIFTFIMEVEGLDFRESLEYLARKAGVDLTMYDSKDSQAIAQRKKRLYMVNDLAVNYYQHSLIENQRAIDYVFKKRNLSKSIVQSFKIGYAPVSGNALVNFLLKRGFTNQELDQAGLTNRFGSDLFRGRMMIPLMDSTGRVIGFTGRIIIDDQKSPKYLNTPQTLLYDKGRHVFGLSQAKESIRSHDYSVIVEGNLDVVSSHQAGITQVVATAGTAMTENHLRALMRLSSQVRLAFDGDRAGLAATERAIPIAQSVNADIKIISMPDSAKDADELVKQGPELWQAAIDTAEPAVDWLIKKYSQRDDLATAAGKRQFTSASLNIVRQLHDSVEREYYVKKIADYSGSSVTALTEKLASSAAPDSSEAPLKKTIKPTTVAQDPDAYQDNLLAVALTLADTSDLLSQIDINEFKGEERQAVAKYLSQSGGKLITDTPEQLQKYDIYVKILLLKADARYANWDDHDRYFEMARLLHQVANESKKKQKNELTGELRDAETLGDDDKANVIRDKLNKLIKEI
jgi:DNA primase